RLGRLSEALEPEGVIGLVRRAVWAQDVEALKRLAAEVAGAAPPAALVKLAHGFNPLSDEAEAERALRAGVLRHANDFWLNHELAMALRKVGPRGATDTVLDRTAERLGYFHTAVALRPNSPGAWLNLGVALGQLKRYAEAEGAFRRA